MSKVKTWQERVLRDKNALPKREMQAEIDELRAKLAAAETSANELRRAVAELIGADPETWPNHGNAPLAIAACVALRQAELAALKAQEPVAYVRFRNGEVDYDEDVVISNIERDCMDESIEWLPVYAAAGASPTCTSDEWLANCPQSVRDLADKIKAGAAPVQQEPEPIQVCRLMKKEEGIWIAASEFYAGNPEQRWVELVSRNPDHWSIQRRVTGKQIADGLAKALAGTPPALEVTECQWSCEDDDSGTRRSSCGELWSFIDGGPDENRVTYCHHCGGKVSNAAAPAAKVPKEQTP